MQYFSPSSLLLKIHQLSMLSISMDNSHYISTLLFIISFILSPYTTKNLFIESATLNIDTDKEALISIKSYITTDPPSVLSSWDQVSSSPCNWTRVVCNRPRTRVAGLNLSGLQITGSISPHIGNLSFLRSLQLQNNRFTGNLPTSLTNLFRLRLLNISSNNIEGVIPSNISQCRDLQIIDLMQNEISGRIPEELTRLTYLQVLNLARNRLSGSIPPSIGNLSSLITLNLGTNTVGGMIPSDLAHLRNLKHLDLTINNLTGTIPPSIYNMSSLESIALASNNLWGEIPYYIGVTLPNLLVFNFCINKFTGRIPGSLHNLTRIKVIRMAENFLHGTVPPGLGNLPELTMYNIGKNRIISSGDEGLGFLTSLVNSKRLNFLAIDENLFEGVIPDSIGNLSKVLKNLYMGGNRISGQIPPSIGQLSGLALLNMSHNSLVGQIPSEIGQLEELQELSLAGNHFSGRVPNSLGNLQKLSQLDLSGNELSGNIPSTFRNFERLLSMDLSNNNLNGSIPREFINLPSLSEILNLSRNSLTGPLPQEVGLMESVATIDLSDNRLSGNIPNSIGNCKSLEELFIANNLFSGNIPNTLGEVKGLTILDLSSNQLSGSIPSELQQLMALQSLNLSFNNLDGAVPTAGIFSNISSVHIEGNTKLCFISECKNRGGKRIGLIIAIIAPTALLVLVLAIGLFFFVRKRKMKITHSNDSFKGQHQIVSYDELRLATGNFNQENLLGKGSFGSVYKGCIREGTAIAVKVLDMEVTGSQKSFLAECSALRHVRHRNLVKLITSCSSIDFKNKEFIALVYELMKRGSLLDWIEGKRRNRYGEGLTFLERLNVAIDVASGLTYLHHECETPVLHCDLKPSNVLLDEDMTAKIGDFGLARLLLERTENDNHSVSSTHSLKGSIGYIPPEYGVGSKPSTAGDVYSYGIMLTELFTGRSPTHESFVGGLSLKTWVQRAFPTNTEQVLDPELLLQIKHSSDDDDDEDGEDAYNDNDGELMSPEIQLDCMVRVIGVGLSCINESPDGRVSIREVVYKLKSIRDTLLKPNQKMKGSR